MSSRDIPLEPADSGRLSFTTGADGTKRIGFRMGPSWPVVIFLAVWLCGWAVGEFMVLTVMLPAAGDSAGGGIFLLVWLTLWTLGGLAAGGFLLWMLLGTEMLEITPSRLIHAYRILGYNRIRAFERSQVANFRFHEQRMRRSTQTSLAFDYGTRNIRIFHSINSAEAERAVEALDLALGRRRDR